MTYIKLEDAKTLASELSGIPVNFLSKFDSLPSIDPQEMINEYLQDIKDNLKKGTNTNLEFTDLIAQKNIIELLLNKLP